VVEEMHQSLFLYINKYRGHSSLITYVTKE